jgi:hypothetical protein
MLGQVAVAIGLVGIGAGLQCWSSAKRQDRKQLIKEDIPRWEDEGGSTPASVAAARPDDTDDEEVPF